MARSRPFVILSLLVLGVWQISLLLSAASTLAFGHTAPLAGRARCTQGPRSLHASIVGLRGRGTYDKEKLENEATWAGDVMRGLSDFFNPKTKEEDPKEVARRVQSSESTEKAIQSLKVSVVAGTDEEGAPQRRDAPISILQSKAKQSLVIYAAVKEQLMTDLALSMRLAADQFNQRNILVIPVLYSVAEAKAIEMSSQVRGSKLMSQKSVALPSITSAEDAAAWGVAIDGEFKEAVAQGSDDKAELGGLVLIVSNDGTLLRRGVGRPNWEVVFRDVDAIDAIA
eukprot:TRINITY_DN82818_c0_g1_i1.p1 TRINITY_DN82818_c0_g1~~TRINITY_DN82818_c0_g1_i1.p1  ORF type:complete len:291 (+),score=63.06 TRINITY_DN82818_c0_g1_i1:22-873(+)